MDKWTMEELENTDDIAFAISELNRRRNGLNPYSPLSMKLSKTIDTLMKIKEEKDRFIARISTTEPADDADAIAQTTIEEAIT